MSNLKTILTRLICLMIFLATSILAGAQQTVFELFKNDASLGDYYFEQKNYQGALKLYLNAAKKSPLTSENHIKVARCYYSLKQYQHSIDYYNHYMKAKQNLPLDDLYCYAEALTVTSNYSEAIESYRKYLAQEPDDEMVIKKIWRLNNIQYLYEDSSQFSIRPISLNTPFGEICPVYFQKGIVFMSNRKETQLVEKVNASLDAPFYRIYYCPVNGETVTDDDLQYGEVSSFNKAFSSRYNAGPVAFYDHDTKMIFTSTGSDVNGNGVRTLQLFFAEKNNGAWAVTKSFPYNSLLFSISDPTISEDGSILCFSSDMNGGFGGRDLYKSTYENGRWTKPQNLGEAINTSKDEAFPYLHKDHTIYFSSNGHPGMGGLDIFKTAIRGDEFGEPENAGYPINSTYDDFGIIIDSLEQHGYLSSNRGHGGFNDDIYAIDMDLQSFPISISGVIKFKEMDWDDSKELEIMSNTKIAVIDNMRNTVVHESVSDRDGNFNITIPYYSKYVIRVKQEGDDEHVAVLEIPKRKKDLSAYEIVIVKDVFKKK